MPEFSTGAFSDLPELEAEAHETPEEFANRHAAAELHRKQVHERHERWHQRFVKLLRRRSADNNGLP